jgi:hypothetical protein
LSNNTKEAGQWIEARLELQSPVFSDKCTARFNETPAILLDSPFNISHTYQNKQQSGTSPSSFMQLLFVTKTARDFFSIELDLGTT